MPNTCTHLKEMNHVRTSLPRPCPSRVGGDLLIEAVLATAIHMSTPTSTTHSIVAAAAQSPMPEFTRCVERRESGGNPRARNPHSSAAGLFQFLAAWRRGLPYMVAERLRDHGMPARQARAIRVDLAAKPIHTWPAAYQRVGHAEVLERGGWWHWKNHDRCDRLAVAR